VGTARPARRGGASRSRNPTPCIRPRRSAAGIFRTPRRANLSRSARSIATKVEDYARRKGLPPSRSNAGWHRTWAMNRPRRLCLRPRQRPGPRSRWRPRRDLPRAAGSRRRRHRNAASPRRCAAFFSVFRYSRHAVRLVWDNQSPALFVAAALTLVGGLLPAGVPGWARASSMRGDGDALEHPRRGRGAATGTAGGPAGRHARRCAARAVAVPGTVARAARPARQRDDPRKSAHPGVAALRGLGVLRQADARPARGLEPAPEPGDAHFRPAAERDLAAELRGTAGALLA